MRDGKKLIFCMVILLLTACDSDFPYYVSDAGESYYSDYHSDLSLIQFDKELVSWTDLQTFIGVNLEEYPFEKTYSSLGEVIDWARKQFGETKFNYRNYLDRIIKTKSLRVISYGNTYNFVLENGNYQLVEVVVVKPTFMSSDSEETFRKLFHRVREEVHTGKPQRVYFRSGGKIYSILFSNAGHDRTNFGSLRYYGSETL